MRLFCYRITCLPSSNACVERIFSFDLLKIENRNKVELNTVESLISTKKYLKSY